MKLGNLLRKLRLGKKLSQQEVADYVGVGQSTYFAWENDRSSPNAKYYVRIAMAFGVDLKELIPDDFTFVVPSLNGMDPEVPVPAVQGLYEELMASQRQVIHFQQQRIQQLETENCRLGEQLKQVPGTMARSLLLIFASINFISFLIESIGESIVMG